MTHHEHKHHHHHGSHDHNHAHDHNHPHDHDHSHDHSHDHHTHGQQHESKTAMSDKEKLVKLLDHWVAHNNDHAENYSQWSEKAEKMGGMEQIAGLLKDAAELTHAISDKFIKAKKNL
jgi:monoamine oxidase